MDFWNNVYFSLPDFNSAFLKWLSLPFHSIAYAIWASYSCIFINFIYVVESFCFLTSVSFDSTCLWTFLSQCRGFDLCWFCFFPCFISCLTLPLYFFPTPFFPFSFKCLHVWKEHLCSRHFSTQLFHGLRYDDGNHSVLQLLPKPLSRAVPIWGLVLIQYSYKEDYHTATFVELVSDIHLVLYMNVYHSNCKIGCPRPY